MPSLLNTSKTSKTSDGIDTNSISSTTYSPSPSAPPSAAPTDGKTLRGSYDPGDDKAALCRVSAWASVNRLILAQEPVSDKSNEITAIPALLSALEISDCLVTIDAMGTQRKIAQQIRNQGGDYMLALKSNPARRSPRAGANAGGGRDNGPVSSLHPVGSVPRQDRWSHERSGSGGVSANRPQTP